MSGETFRMDTDSMGEVKVPAWAYWGAQTQRAVENFSVSDLRIPTPLVRALGLVKQVSATVNDELGLLEPRVAEAIASAAKEVAEGKWDAHFPSMSSSRLRHILEHERERGDCQPGQRAAWLPPGLEEARSSQRPREPRAVVEQRHSHRDQHCGPPAAQWPGQCAGNAARQPSRKAAELDAVLKIGRTHLQDAVPMTLGQEFSGYARQVQKGAGVSPALRPGPGGACHRRHGHRDGHQHASRLRAAGVGGDCDADGRSLSRGGEQVRGHQRARRAGGADGRSERAVCFPDEDRQ